MTASEGPGRELPGRDAYAQPGWRPGDHLWPPEADMLRGAEAGERVALGEGPFDPAAMKASEPSRAIRAAVLRHLLVAGDWPVHAKGVRLRGVRISGHLDLESATIRCPLHLENCYLDAPQPVILDYATVSLLTFTGCYLAGLTADTITVTKELDLSGSILTGPLRLRDADITGQLACTGIQLTGPDLDGNALVADRIKVGGGVDLSGGFIAAGAVRLAGAEITGGLDFSGAKMTGADPDGTSLDGLRIKVGGGVKLQRVVAAGNVVLFGAQITGSLDCGAAQLTGAGYRGLLEAGEMTLGGDMHLNRFTAAGVSIVGAQITGDLSCRGAQLAGVEEYGSTTLVADRIAVGGNVLLTHDFTAAGTVRLASAQISGDLKCSHARFAGADNQDDALNADEMKIGGNVLFDLGFNAEKAVRLVGAEITGNFQCRIANLSGADRRGYSLRIDWMKVGREMFLGPYLTAVGTISLTEVRVNGSLWLQPWELAEGKDAKGEDRVALMATGAQIGYVLSWAPGRPVNGLVNLEDATVGLLEDFWADPDGSEWPNGHWPPADQGLLRLGGFTYARIGGDPPANLEQRLAWIGSQPKRATARKRAEFVTQPYEQLIRVYQQAGQDTEARTVAVARRRDLRRYGDLTRSRKVGNWLLDVTIRYGYQTWRAVVGLGAIYAVVLTIF